MSKCIIWNKGIWSQGRYGRRYLNGVEMGAHRAAWIEKYGPIPKGLFVCHHCDNGLCVNTEHLFLGSNRDNQIDSVVKGRNPTLYKSGLSNPSANPEVIKNYRAIQEAKKQGLTCKAIREKFGLKSDGHLYKILRYALINP